MNPAEHSTSPHFLRDQHSSPLRHPAPEGAPVVIVSGGTLGEWALPYLREPQAYRIGADRGAWFLLEHGFPPDAALGDFDSVTPEEREHLRARCPHFLDCDSVHKDWTDTEWALDWALQKRAGSITLLGATGTRMDHTLANILLLQKAAAHRVPTRIIDANNEISLASGPDTVILTQGCHPQVSLLPLSPSVQGVTLEGFLYPLHEATLVSGSTLGISNVLQEAVGRITIRQGQLLILRSRD